jgi:glutamine synthetase
VKEMVGVHSSERVAEEIVRLVERNGITDVSACVTDTAAVMVKAGKQLQWPWMGCFAHTQELTSSLLFKHPLMDFTMSKIRDLATYFTSAKQKELLLDAQKRHRQPGDKRKAVVMKNDVITRWGSTWMMGDRALRLKRTLKMMAAEGILQLEVTERDWCILELATELLRPMAEVQRLLEGDQYVTLSMVPISISKVRSGLRDAANMVGAAGDTPAMAAARRDVKEVAASMLEDYISR